MHPWFTAGDETGERQTNIQYNSTAGFSYTRPPSSSTPKIRSFLRKDKGGGLGGRAASTFRDCKEIVLIHSFRSFYEGHHRNLGRSPHE